jgi:hypothetical protein
MRSSIKRIFSYEPGRKHFYYPCSKGLDFHVTPGRSSAVVSAELNTFIAIIKSLHPIQFLLCTPWLTCHLISFLISTDISVSLSSTLHLIFSLHPHSKCVASHCAESSSTPLRCAYSVNICSVSVIHLPTLSEVQILERRISVWDWTVNCKWYVTKRLRTALMYHPAIWMEGLRKTARSP